MIAALRGELAQEQQQKIALSVELVRARNDANVLRKENQFYRGAVKQAEAERQASERRRSEFRELKEAFRELKREVGVLNEMAQ